MSAAERRRRSLGPTELLQAAAIARRHFLEGQSKVAIARDLGMSRFKVARVLRSCLDEGIVRIDIRLPAVLDADLSDRLRQVYGLEHALVAAVPAEPEAELRDQLGRVTADLLAELITSDDVLGIGWGRTLQAMVEALDELPPCAVVQLTGSVGAVSDHSTELVRRVGAVSGGPTYPIYAPLIVRDAETAQALRREPVIAEALRRSDLVTTAVVAVGSWDPPNSKLREAVEPDARAALERKGVVAEICSTLVDREGNLVTSSLGARSIAVSADQLRRIPRVIAVAGGRTKAKALRAVLRGGLASSVVTDVTAAGYLLETSPRERPR